MISWKRLEEGLRNALGMLAFEGSYHVDIDKKRNILPLETVFVRSMSTAHKD